MKKIFTKALIVFTILTLLFVSLPVSDASAASKMTVYEHVAFDTGTLQLFPSNVQGFGVQTDTCSVMGVIGQASFNSSGVGYYRFYGTPKYIGSCTYSVKYNMNNIPDYTFTVEFTVSNTAEAPTASVLGNNTVYENMASGTIVGYLSYTDPDIAEGKQTTAPSYQIVGGADASSFTLQSSWGFYSLITNASFDSEASATREVIIRVIETSSLYADTTHTISILNVNEAPYALSISKSSVDEHAALNTVVGSFSTGDPDSGDTFTYTLVSGTGSTDNASFNISGSSLRTSAVFNYEVDSSYDIRVRSTDSGGLYFEKAFTVAISNVNEAPVITSNGGAATAALSVAENSTAVTTVAATDGDLPAPTLTYTISGGVDSAKFSIVSGVLTFASAPNFESPGDSGANNVYDVIVRVSDGTLTDTQALAVSVTNVNETPTDISLSTSSVAENAAVNTVVGTLTSTDPDAGSTFTYALVSGTGDTDNTSFNISGASLRTSAGFDYETDNSYSIRVRSTDQSGVLYYDEVLTISITNVNETPTDILLSSSSVAENAAANTVVGALTSTDPDAGSTFTYTLVAGTGSTDNASFNISGADLRTSAAFNYEAKSSYFIRLRSTDQGGVLYFEKSFTITVTNVNEAPTDISLSSSSVAENAAVNTVVGALTTTDVDSGNTFTYTLVAGTGSTDNASFNISGASLRTSAAFNYETKSSYSIRVRSTDQGGVLYFEKAFTITVTNVNETPTDISLSSSSVAENLAANSGVGTLTTTDPDAGNTFTYTLVTGIGSTDNASFNILAANLRTSAVFDHETRDSYSIRVRATDQGGLYFEEAFTITIGDANDAPIITSNGSGANAVLSIAENGTAVTTITAADVDLPAQTLTYTISGGVDSAKFSITAGVLKFASAPNFEVRGDSGANNVYDVIVRVSDGTLTDTQAIAISVTDVNENPTNISLSPATVAENQAVGTLVGALTSTDPDPGNTFTYSLVSGDTGSFSLTGANLYTSAAFDLETKSSYSVTVRSTDQGGLSYDKALTISITNINETPTDIGLSPASVAENKALGTVVGALTTTDVDSGNTFTYTLVAGTGGTDNASFNILAANLRTSAVFDYETRASYSIRVRSTDQGGLYLEKALTITISDANDAPVITSNGGGAAAAVSVAENSTAVTTASAADVDLPAQTLTYTISGGVDSAKFTITSGVLTFASAPDVESPGDSGADNVYDVIVQVSDGTLTDTQAIAVSVTNVNEDPTHISLSPASVGENQAVGTVVGAFTTTDTDAGNTFTYSLVSGDGSTDNASFDISGTNLITKAGFDYETKTSYSIRVRSTDQGGLWTEKELTITISDANDAPTNIGLSTASVAENQAVGTEVGALTTTDPDTGNTFTYSLVSGDTASFNISGAKLRTSAAFDFETTSSYSVTVRATDQGGLYFEKAFTITVTNINEAPVITAQAALSTLEDTALGIAFANLTVTDVDNTYSTDFTLTVLAGTNYTRSGNTITPAANFNGTLTVPVKVKDGALDSNTFDLSVTVSAVNDAPTVISLSPASVAENAAADTLVGAFTSTDPDAGNTFTYRLVTGTGDTNNASFNIVGANLRTSAGFNFETKASYSIRVSSTDLDSASFEQELTINVTNVNETPTGISLDDASVDENKEADTVVGALTTTDPDASNTFTYTLVSGNGSTDNASFNISAANLQTTFAFNHEAKESYSIRVRSTDQGGFWTEKELTITVTDVNEAPTDITLDNNGVLENAVGNTDINRLVGAFTSTDPDTGSTFTYTLPVDISTDNASFNIQIQGANLQTSDVFTYITKSSYSIRVRSTDQGGVENYEKVFQIIIIRLPPADPKSIIWPTASAITFGQTLANSTLSGGSAKQTDDITSLSGTFTFNTPATAPNVGTASQSVTFTPPDLDAYKQVTGTVEVEVKPAPAAVTTWPTATAITYGQTLYDSTLSGGAAATAGSFAFTTPSTAPDAGTADQNVIFVPYDGNYGSVSEKVSVTVDLADQTIAFTSSAPTAVVGGTTYTPTATGGASGVAVVISSATTSVCSISGGIVSFDTAGTCTLNANQAGSSNYNAAAQVQQSFAVAKAASSVTTWPTASAITFGQTLASSTLTGGVGVPAAGSFAFTTPATAPNVGTASQSVTFTPTDPNYKTTTGTVSVTVGKAVPSVTTWPTATAITYGQMLVDSTLSSGVAQSGSFAFTAPATVPNAGTASQSVTFTPTDISNYSSSTHTVSVTVGKLGQTAAFTSTAPAGAVAGGTAYTPTAVGSASGISVVISSATPLVCSISGGMVSFLKIGTCTLNANQAAGDNYFAATQVEQSFTVGKGNSSVTTWPAAADITYGQTLASSALTGGVGVPASGSFAFTTPATEPGVGTASQGVTFTSTDSANYNSTTGTVSVTVNKAESGVTTWPTAAGITYGQMLVDSTLSGGVAVQSGSFAFTAPVTVPNAGTASQSVTFTPADTGNYKSSTHTVSVTVGKLGQTVAFTSTAPVSAVQGGAAYTPKADGSASGISVVISSATPLVCPIDTNGFVSFLTAGTCTLNANQAGDGNHFAATEAGQEFAVGKAISSVTTWPTAGAITFGDSLSVSTFTGGSAKKAGGLVDLPGSFAFTTPGMVPNVGTALQSVTFTPDDSANYDSPTGSVNVTVNKAAQNIAFTSSAPASATVDGIAYTPAVTGGASGVTIELTIADAASSVCSISGGIVSFDTAGTCTINANQAGSGNYYAASQVQQSFVVGKADSSVTTWPTAAGITYGQALSDSTLSGGVATPAGSFAFTVPAMVPNVGTVSLGVTFTPADTTNFKSTTGSASVTVTKADQSINFTSDAPASASVGGAVYKPAATGGGSGNMVVLTIDSTAAPVCSISGGDVSFLTIGNCVINANQAGSSNYTVASLIQQSFTVGKAIPIVTTWPAAGDIIFGQTLADSTLTGGSATPAGSFAFTSPATKPGPGTASQSVTFTPNDTSNFNPVVSTTSVTVKKITPVITFGLAPSPAYSDNFVVSAATSNTDSRALTYGWISGPCAGVSVSTFTATGVGTCVVQALGAESTNFFTGSQTQSVTIGRMTPNLTWTAPTDIPYGTALSATQLNAAIGGGVPGTLSYTPAAGAILPVGTSLLTVEFTPTDSTLYDGATKKVNLEVSAPSAPAITGLSLDIGPTTGDSPVIISGTNLYNGKVTFGGVSGACSVDSITQITCTTPVHSLGSVNVEIVTPGGTTAPNQLFTYVQTTMLGISPSQGPVTGGTTVILSGVQKFITASFGGTTAACTSISNNQIRCVTPAHAAGQVDVIVTTGYAELTAANGFTYVPAPKAQVSPGSGPVTSGTSIIITGTGFDNTTAVTFGGSAASCSLVSSTEMNCTAPPHAAGTVNVKIVNAGAAEYIDAFTYVEAYFSANIKPSFGLMSGGTTVTINDGTGTDFTGATAVTFGGTNVASFTIVSATKISVVSPAHTSGMVDIVISTPSGTVTYADGFTFSGTTPLLTLDSVSLDGSITFASDSPSQLTIKFNMALMNVPDGDPNWPYSAINPENYLLYSSGLNGIFETQSCQDGLQGDDEQVLTDSDSYDPASYTVTITVNAGLPLPTNAYQLLVCGTTSIKSTTGVKLNSGLEDALFRFAIVADPLVNSKLPETGFAPNRITILPAQDQAYTTMTDLWLEIPTIDVKMNIVGVPQSTDSWDILWLGKDAGYLEGSAYPTHPGNSVLTGHVWDSFNRPGPFANLSKLKYGDQIKIHLSGQVYTYEVRENKLIRPGDVNAAMKHEELSWVTLLTCDSYQAGTDSYTYRRIVRAVLIDFK